MSRLLESAINLTDSCICLLFVRFFVCLSLYLFVDLLGPCELVAFLSVSVGCVCRLCLLV